MALSNKKYTAIHSKTGSDKDALKDEFDAGYLSKICDIPSKEPALTALVYQIGLLQEELDYLRTEISSNKDNRIVVGSNTVISFGDMVSTTVKGKTTYSIVMTVAFTDPVSSKVTTKTTTLTLA
jgi:hypothetical protein